MQRAGVRHAPQILVELQVDLGDQIVRIEPQRLRELVARVFEQMPFFRAGEFGSVPAFCSSAPQ